MFVKFCSFCKKKSFHKYSLYGNLRCKTCFNKILRRDDNAISERAKPREAKAIEHMKPHTEQHVEQPTPISVTKKVNTDCDWNIIFSKWSN